MLSRATQEEASLRGRRDMQSRDTAPARLGDGDSDFRGAPGIVSSGGWHENIH